MSHRPSPPRGSALLVTVVLLAVLMLMAGGLLGYVQSERGRAIQVSRAQRRESCAQAGLQLAKSYFGRNFPTWNTYLADPNFSAVPTDGGTLDPAAIASIKAAQPQLLADLDGDSAPDVYLYVRDNDDEFPPAAANPARDNDQAVIVGAVCISTTMVPHRSDGTSSPTQLTEEGLLEYNVSGSTYITQAGAGSSGTGNQNH